jgi:ankyrin repeat protein
LCWAAGLQFGNVALLMAARKDFIGCMRLLINAGADVNFVGPAGMTALMWSAWSGNIAGLELLLRVPGLQTNMLSEVGGGEV